MTKRKQPDHRNHQKNRKQREENTAGYGNKKLEGPDRPST